MQAVVSPTGLAGRGGGGGSSSARNRSHLGCRAGGRPGFGLGERVDGVFSPGGKRA
jgi:hypothetical protein